MRKEKRHKLSISRRKPDYQQAPWASEIIIEHWEQLHTHHFDNLEEEMDHLVENTNYYTSLNTK